MLENQALMRRLAIALLASLAIACDRPRDKPSTLPAATTSAVAASDATSTAVASAGTAPAPPTVDPTPVIARAMAQGCEAGTGVAFLVAPLAPHMGTPLRILATSDAQAPTGIVVLPPHGDAVSLAVEPRLGPPPSALGQIDAPEEGAYRVALHAGTTLLGCTKVTVTAKAARPPKMASSSGGWDVKHNWTPADEGLYAAWVEKLFDAPLTEQPSFHSLDEVTSDPKKNFLHDYLELGEDAPPSKGMRLRPDCADLPFTLRAYFAWKMKLPLGFSACSRGGGGRPPTCPHHFTNLDPMEDGPHENFRRFEEFARKNVGDTVHSGTGRTRGDDDATDYYPIKLAPGTLRPGVVYADPYGHTLVVAKIIPQTDDASGILLAVDAQPDGTVARKRFWEGNFLFSLEDPASGGPGFKRFRKLDMARGMKLVPNAELGKDPAYTDFGLDQYAGGAQQFYDKMEDVLNPKPRDPERALLDTIQALEEQAKTRVNSVGNGEDRFKKSQGVIPMPDGPTLFETEGEWEDFSTPSRDMRMLIAIDVATGFPARFARRSERFKVPAGKTNDEVVADLKTVLDRELHARKLTYTRMDGSSFTLSLADVIDRQKGLEMAYNPNDCVEVRWGAPEGSDEIKTCKRRAPVDQRAKMEKVRSWFATRKRPFRK
jgi:hypothetical protein